MKSTTIINYLFLSTFLFYLKASTKYIVDAKFCSFSSKEKYKSGNSDMKNIMEFMSNQPLAHWYTDRDNSLQNAKDNLSNFVNGCGQEEPVIAIYGIPNKDCDAGESSSGFNKNSNDYKSFLNSANSILNNKQTTIILEPDAVALTTDKSKCGNFKGYKDNLKMSIEILGEASNYKLYIDVGHWIVIYGDDKIKEMINFINEIDPANKLKGFSLNLSNYRKTEEMVDACKNIRKVSGKDYKCIIDTSRNYKGPSDKGTWCNYKNAGIGFSGNDNNLVKDSSIDAYVWIKPAGELDGSCYGNDDSYQSNKGAGAFDENWLNILWNNGAYRDKKIETGDMPIVNPQENPQQNTQRPSNIEMSLPVTIEEFKPSYSNNVISYVKEKNTNSIKICKA